MAGKPFALCLYVRARMFTWNNTWNEIEEAHATTAVVTIGSTEQHGTHLPLRTDTLIAERFAHAIAERLHAYLTPSIPIGQSAMWLDFPGSLSFSTETMRGMITDIVESLVKTGFITILFVSIHGANVEVYQGYPESLQERYPGVKILTIGYPFWVREHWAQLWAEALAEAGLPEMNHADEAETSLMLALCPALVGPHPTDCPLPEDRYPAGKTMRETYPSGSMGYGSRASREKGEKLWDALRRRVVADLQSRW